MKKSLYLFFAVLTVSALALAACAPATPAPTEEPEPVMTEEPAPAPTEEPAPAPTEEPMPAIGSPEHPIKVLFIPSVDADFIVDNADAVTQAFSDATGLSIDASVLTSYGAAIEELCASPTDTIAFISATPYILANDLCGAEVSLAAVRRGYNVYWSQFIVARDSDINSFEDLEGKTWGFGSGGSTSGYVLPSALLDDAGITSGEQVETGGHSNSALAVYNGEVEFGTTYFSPPTLPDGTKWQSGDAPDIPEDLISECGVDADGALNCGGYIVNDARNTIIDVAPDVVQKVKILTLTSDIPNDAMVYGPEFPDDLKEAINAAVIAYVQSEACAETFCHENFYEWTDAGPIHDESFDSIRILMKYLGITMDNYED